jgi:hypothetical protein
MLYPSRGPSAVEAAEDKDKLKEREMLIGVVRLLNSNSEEDKKRARRYLAAKHQNFTDEDLEQFGLKRPEKDERSLFEKAAGLPGVSTALSVVGTAGGALGRVGEYTQRQLQQTGQTIGDVGNAAINAAVPGDPRGGGITLADVPSRWHQRNVDMAKATTDITGKSDLNTRSMLGLDKDLGGDGWFGKYVVGTADLAGELATDPTSYVGTAGAVQGTRVGLEAAERAAQVVTGKAGFRGMIEHAGMKGAQEAWGLSDETMEAIAKEAVRDMGERGAAVHAGQRGRILSKLGAPGPKKGGPWGRFVDNATADGAGTKGSMKGLVGEERLAQRHWNLATMRGQKGIKFGNQTVIPSNSWRAPFAKYKLIKSTRIVGNKDAQRIVASVENLDQQAEHAQMEIDRLSADPTPNGRTLQSIEHWEKKLADNAEERAAYMDELDSLRSEGLDVNTITEPNPAFEEALNDPANLFQPGQPRTFPFRETEPVPPTIRLSAAEEASEATRLGARNKQFETGGSLEQLRANIDEFAAGNRELADRLFTDALRKIPHENVPEANFPLMTGANALFENYDPTMIAGFENVRGPAVYGSGSVPITGGYMRSTLNRLPDAETNPTRYINEWIGAEPYNPWDINKAAPVPEHVQNTVMEQVEQIVNRYAYSPENTESTLGGLDELDAAAQKVRDLMAEGAPFAEVYSAFREVAHAAGRRARDIDGTLEILEEMADEGVAAINAAVGDVGVHSFVEEGGHLAGRGTIAHPVHMILDPANVKPKPMPPETITTETLTPEAAELTAKVADVEKRRARLQKGLDAANERAALQTPAGLRTRIEEARAVVEADEALDAEAKALRTRIKQAKAAAKAEAPASAPAPTKQGPGELLDTAPETAVEPAVTATPQAEARRLLDENAAKQAEYDRMVEFHRQSEAQIDAQYAASDRGLEATNYMEAQAAELERFEDEMNILGGELLMDEQVEELTRRANSLDTSAAQGIPIEASAKTEDELLNEIGDMLTAPLSPEQAAQRAAERAVDLPPAHEAYGGFIEQTPDGRLTIDGAPAEKLYRVVSNEEWAEAQRTGKLAGGQGKYTRASALPDQRWTQEGGHVVEITYDPTDAWSASAEGYAATKQPIDISKVRAVEGDEQAELFARNQDYQAARKAERQAALDAEGEPTNESRLASLDDQARLRELTKGRASKADRTATKAKLKELEEKLAKMTGERQQKLDAKTALMDTLTERKNNLIAQRERMPDVVAETVPSRFTKGSRTLENLKQAFVTHNPVRKGHGNRAAELLGTGQEAAKGFAKHYGEDALVSFQNTTAAAVRDPGVTPSSWAEDLRTRIMPALEREGGSEELYEEFIDEGRQAAADFLENYDRVRFGITDDLVKQGKIPAEFMHDPNTYVMRLLEPAAQEALEDYFKAQSVAGEVVGKPNQLAGELTQGGAMDERTFHPELAGDELNKQAAAEFEGEIAPGWGDKPVYRQDPVLSAAVKAQLAGKQIGAQGMLDSLLGEFDDVGRPLLTTDKDIAKSLRYVPISATNETGAGVTHYAPKAIADDMARFQAVLVNDDSIAKAAGFMDKVQKVWKAHATVPLIGGAFHMRNGQTNVVLNWAAGMGASSLPFYAKAAKLQNRAWDAAKELGKDPELVTLDDILNASGKLSKHERMVLEQARKHNIFGSSFFSTDLRSTGGRALEQRAVPQTKMRRTLGKLNPFDLNNFFGIKSGHAVAGAIENNARLAHFMWAMDKFGDAETAAMSVKKYLFNYDDLTDFEKTVMKKWIPFYTFMRKNAEAVGSTLANNPGKVNRYLMAEKGLEDSDAEWLKGKNIPGYQLLGGMAPRKGGPDNVVLGMESPFSAAAQTAAPFIQAAGETPGLTRLVPDAMKNPEGKEGALRELLNIPGGPVPEAIGVAAEHAFDINTFTGGDKPRQDLPDKIMEALGIIAPSPSKLNRTVDNLTLGKYKDVEGEERTSRRTATLINLLTGLNAAGVGPVSSEKSFEGQWYNYINDWIEKQNEGLDPSDPEYIPTLEIIQEIMGKNLPPGGLRRGSGSQPKSIMDLLGG